MQIGCNKGNYPMAWFPETLAHTILFFPAMAAYFAERVSSGEGLKSHSLTFKTNA